MDLDHIRRSKQIDFGSILFTVVVHSNEQLDDSGDVKRTERKEKPSHDHSNGNDIDPVNTGQLRPRKQTTLGNRFGLSFFFFIGFVYFLGCANSRLIW